MLLPRNIATATQDARAFMYNPLKLVLDLGLDPKSRLPAMSITPCKPFTSLQHTQLVEACVQKSLCCSFAGQDPPGIYARA